MCIFAAQLELSYTRSPDNSFALHNQDIDAYISADFHFNGYCVVLFISIQILIERSVSKHWRP